MGFFDRIRGRKLSRKTTSEPAGPIVFNSLEPLEPRLLLSADMSLAALAGESLDLTLRLGSGSQELQIVDNTTQIVLHSQLFADTNSVVIKGADQDDKLIVDLSTPFSLPGGITFEDTSDSDNDTLEVIGQDNLFNITGSNEGNVNGSIDFTGIENLVGDAGTDSYKFTATGSISGTVDGASGSFDTVEVQESNYDFVVFNYTGSGSGKIELDGAVVALYSRMEAITLVSSGRSPPTAVIINVPTAAADEFTLRDDGTAGNGIIVIESTNGTLTDTTFEAPTGSLIVKSGSGNDIVTIDQALEPGFDVFINGEAGNDTLIGPDSDRIWVIVGANSGRVEGIASTGAGFAGIENLTGGTGEDIFLFADGHRSRVSGSIDGGGGTNTLDYSHCPSGIFVNLGADAATGTGGISNIQNVIGSPGNDTLIGPLSNSTWNITGINEGDVEGFLFANIENLTGQADNEDTFVFKAVGSISGIVEGGDGGFDTIVLDGDGFDTIIYNFTGPDSGSIIRDSDVITYSGLEPLTTNPTPLLPTTPTVANVILNYNVAFAQTITIVNGPAGQITVESDGVEDPTFNNPSISLTINGGSNVDNITIQSLDPAFDANLIINSGDGADIITVNATTGTTNTYTIDAGAGQNSITFADGLTRPIDVTGGSSNDTYNINGDWGTITIHESPGGGNDTLDFAGYPGVLTVAIDGLTITGDNGGTISTITVVGEAIENIDNATVGFTNIKDTLLSGLQSLVNWAKELAIYGDMAAKLPIVAGNVEIGVGTALEIAEALDQLRIKFKNYLAPLSTITTDDLLDAVGGAGGFTKSAIEHLDRGILGDIIFEGNLNAVNARLTGGSFSFAIKINDGSEITIGPLFSNIPNILIANINAAISGKSSLVGKVAAVISEGRFAFQSIDPEFDKLEVKGLANAVDILGFKGSFQSVVKGVLEELGDLTVKVLPGVTLDTNFVGGVLELRLNINFDADRTTGFNINLGPEGSDAYGFGLNFDVSGTIDIESHFDADLAIGLRLTASPTFFLDITNLGATATISTTTLGVNLDIGFLGASIANGSVTMNAGLDVNLSKSTGITVSDLNPASIGSLVSGLSITSNSLSVFDLPVKVTAGLGGFNTTVKAKIILDSTAPVPDLFSGDPLDIKIEDVDLADGLGVDDLINFNNTSVSGILSLIRRLASALDDVSNSEIFSSFEIPFLGADLSDALDFGDMVQDALIYDDHDDDNDATGTDKLLDSDNNPTFTNAQSFAQRLADILPLNLAGIAATYVPGTYDVLKYHIELTNTFADIDFPVDFNFDLSPLLDLNSNLELTLHAGGGMTLDIGMYLGDVPSTSSLGSIDINTTLDAIGVDIKTEQAITAENKVASFYGRLSEAAHFSITIGGTEYDITVPVVYINTTVDDLKQNINTALGLAYDAVGDTTEDLTDGTGPKITVTSDGARIKLSSTSDFSLKALSSDTAVKEIRFSTEQTATNLFLTATSAPSVFQLTDNAVFTLSITESGGSPVDTKVTIRGESTEYFTTLDELIENINLSLVLANLGGQVRALKDGTKIKLLALDGSVTAFDLSTDSGEPGNTELGFGTSQSAAASGDKSLYTLADLRQYRGRLSDDAHFSISVNGGTAYPFTLDRTATGSNRNMIDLLNDINAALGVASVKTGSISTFIPGSDATFNIKINDTGSFIPVLVQKSTTDGTYYVSFNGDTNVDIATDKITIGAHTYLTGQSVVYTNGGGANVVGLAHGATYYVIAVDSSTVKLAATRTDALQENAINLTVAGSGANQRLTETANTKIEDLVDDINRAINGTSLSGKVRAKKSGDNHIRINAIDPFITEFQLTASGSATADLKLPANETVIRYDGVVVANSAGSYLVLSAVTVEAEFDGSEEYDDVTRTGVVDITNDLLRIGHHDFLTGQAVTYSSGTGGASIDTSSGLLTEGGTYYVIVVNSSTIKLAADKPNAMAGTAIDLTAAGTGSEHTLTTSAATGLTISITGGDTATTELGFGTSQSSNQHDLVIHLSNGTSYDVELDGAIDLGAVIERIVDRTGGSGTINRADPISAGDPNRFNGLIYGNVEVYFNDTDTGLIVEDLTGGSSTVFHIEGTNGSLAVLQLGIMRFDVNADQDDDGDIDADDGDGIIEGAPLAGTNPADRFFIENATVKGSFDFSGDVDASAMFGFVGISLDGTAKLKGEIEAGLKHPEEASPGGRLTLNEIINGLGEIRDIVVLPTLTPLLDPDGTDADDGNPANDIFGFLDVEIGLEPDIADIFIGGPLQITITVNSLGNPFAENVFASPSFVASDEFTVSGDYSHIFKSGLKIITESSPAVTAEVLESSFDDVNTTTVKLVSKVLTSSLSKITAPTPPSITLPDFDTLLGDLAKFDEINFDSIIAALKQVLDFIGELEQFDFLSDPIPLINKSVHDLMGFFDKFSDAIDAAENSATSTLQVLEAALLDALGLSPVTSLFGLAEGLEYVSGTAFKLAGDVTAKFVADFQVKIGEDVSSVVSAAYNAVSDKTTINLSDSIIPAVLSGLDIFVSRFQAFSDAADGLVRMANDKFKLTGDLRSTLALGSKIDFGSGIFSNVKSIVYNTVTNATEITLFDDILTGALATLSNLDIAPDFIDFGIESIGGMDILRIDLMLAAGFNESLNVEIPDFLDIPALDLLGLDFAGSANLNAAGSILVNLDIGIAIDSDHLGQVFVYDTTGLEAKLVIGGSNMAFRAALGPLALNVINGTASIGGTFELDIKDSVFTDGIAPIASLVNISNIDLALDGFINVTLPTYFPRESNYIGDISLSIPNLSAYINNLSDIIDEFDYTAVVDYIKNFDFSKFNIFDSVLLAVDGVDMFLEGLQSLLGGEVFGFKLPIIGDALADGADFIEDLREDFIDPFRDLLEKAPDLAKDFVNPNKNVISDFLFDVLGSAANGATGSALDLLIKEDPSSGDPSFDSGGNFESVDGPGDIKLGGHQALDDYLFNPDTTVQRDDIYIEWDMHLGQSYSLGTGIDFDLGIPGLGIETEGEINVTLTWDLDFGFGISFAEGPYLIISDAQELTFSIDVDLTGVTLTGKLGFLQLSASVVEDDFSASFGININNRNDTPGNVDDRLSFTEIGSIGLEALLAASAFVDLDLALELNKDLIGSSVASGFPKLGSGFVFDWGFDATSITDPGFTDAIKEGLKLVEFQEIYLDLGSFVSDVLGPIVSKVQMVTEPIQPLIDVFTTPIPILDNFGLEITFLDIAAAYGNVNPAMIYAIADIITFINDIPNPDDIGSLRLPFGNFTVFDDGTSTHRNPSGGTYEPALWDSGLDTSGPDPDSVINYIVDHASEFLSSAFGDNWFSDTLGTLAGEAAEIMKDAVDTGGGSEGGFAFPILEDPTQIFGLLMGRPAVLVTYDMPPLEFDFEWSQFFSIWGPLGVSINAEFGVTIDFAFGYDTLGIQQFIESDFRDFAALLNGFYVSDTDLATGDFGKDVPEVVVDGGIWAAAEINLVMVRAGVGGGVFFEINFNLNDPDGDGRVRISEIIGNIANQLKAPNIAERFLAPIAMFDVSGRLFAKLFAFLKIDLFLFEINKRWDITPEIEILNFEIDFYRPPQLATVQKLSGTSVLQLNIGEFAARRLHGDLSDSGETISVSGNKNKLTVTGFGVTIDYEPESGTFSKIFALGGEGNDFIDLSGVTDSDIFFEIEGGPGNDTIKIGAGPALVKGGSGDDKIWGGSGNDIIYGGKGLDEIHGGDGKDLLFGDDGKISDASVRVVVDISDSDDKIYGDGGRDILFGGGGADTIEGGALGDIIIGDGGEVIFTNSSVSKTADNVLSIYRLRNDDPGPGVTGIEKGGMGGNDTLKGDGGDDLIFGGVGNDRLEGGAGMDKLFGGTGFDTIYGNGGADTIFGDGWRVVNDDGTRVLMPTADGQADTIYGGTGGDTIYGGGGGDHIEGGGNSGEDVIYGGPGADVLYGDSPDPDDPEGYGIDIIYGEGGPDIIYGGGDRDTIDGGAGDDVIFGDYGPEDFKPGTTGTPSTPWKVQVYGRNIPTDYLLGTTKSYSHSEEAHAGRDTIYVSAGSDFVDGQGDYDTYIIKLQGADKDSRINIHDSGDALDETDIIHVFGTVYDDEFLLRASVSLGGLAFVALINDDPALERVNYWNTERLVVEGSFGDDFFAVDDVRGETTITGGIGEDLFQIGQIYRSQRNPDPQYANIEVEDVFATIETTRGWLSNGISQPMTINGGVGNDNFIVFHNKAVLTLNGEDGDDTFLIKAFALAGSQEPIRERTDISGGAGADLVQYAMNAPVNIDGGDGFDTVIVIGTEFGDDFVITKDGVYGAGLNVNFVNIESLQVDGAEGDDRFYVLSTSEDIITEIAGGLGSDTFNMSGDTPPIISNDLRGHSGVITHSIEAIDPLYTGIKIDGISANVADDDVTNVVVLTEFLGSTVITEGSTVDWYSVVLTEMPAGDLLIQAYAPVQTEDQKELGSKAFKLYSSTATTISDDGTSLTLKFTTLNWSTLQWVRVDALSDSSEPLDYDDDAIEGTRNGVINHRVMNPTTIISSPDSFSGTTFIDETKGTILADTTQDFLSFDGDLTGMMVLITDGPGAGQSLRIKKYNLHTLTLYGEFSADYMPDSSSTYIITKDIEAIRSINVKIFDNDSPAVRVYQTSDSTEIHEGGEDDLLYVVLTHLPTDDIEVTLSDDYGQSTITSLEAGATNNPDGTVTLTFTSGNWNLLQTVKVTANDDSVREGFHHGLITFTIDSVNDTDIDQEIPTTDDPFVFTDGPEAFVGLARKPVSSAGVTVLVDGSPRAASLYRVISNKILFLDADGAIEFLPEGTTVVVSYNYYDPGYEALENKRGFSVKPILTTIADNDVGQVWIRETYDSTDVIERETSPDSVPWTDTYTVMLTKKPDSNVTITITPKDTKTSSGKVVYFGKQVTVTSSATGAVNNLDGTVTLTFTDTNWSSPQVVTVTAIDDALGDGDDTQVFAPMLHTVSEIQGPLFIYGASGKGSLISLEPLMLSHELNIKPETGEVDTVNEDGTIITVDKAAIDALIASETGGGSTPTYFEHLVEKKRTFEITEGPALDQFRLIVDVLEDGSSLIFFMNKAFTLSGVTFDGSSSEVIFPGSDLLNVGSHKFVTGQSVAYSNGGGTDIGGLNDGVTYYVIVMSPTTVKLASSQINALAYTDTNNTAIDLTGAGTGTDHQLNERFADIKKYAITRESPNFWAIEEEQIDYLFLNNEDSPADNVIDTRKGMLSDATTIGFADNSTLEEFVKNMDGKRITGLGMGGDLYVGGVLQPGGITYGDLEVVEINLGRGIDDFTVTDTHSRADGFQTWVIINTGDEPVEGDGDTVHILSLGSDAQEIFTGAVDISIGLTFTDSSENFPTEGIGLAGFIVEITAGAGLGQSRVIDSNTATDITVVSNWTTPLNDSSQYRVISTVLQSGETSSALVHEGTTLEDLGAGFTTDLVGCIIEITDGPGAGQKKEVIAVADSENLTVSSPWEISDESTPANSRYRIYGEVDGPIAINTQGGDDIVTVDEATTSIPLVIFGGAGNDELEGGSADDIIFGDEGRVDYIDENGKVVTRLGVMRQLVEPSQITTAGNSHAGPMPYYLYDSAANFPTEDEGLKGLIVSITDGPDYRYLGQNRIIIGNTNKTLFLNEAWERIPDSSYKYRISMIPEDQTDAVVRQPGLIISLNHDVGGIDEIVGNAGDDTILGGTDADIIDGNAGDDIIIGDNGRLDLGHVRTDIPSLGEFAPTALDLIQTTHHDTGAVDTISGNEGADIIMGGNDGDLLYGDDDTGSAGAADGGDILIGDNGEIVLISGVIAQIRTTDNLETTGGADTITGNYGDDIILGGVNGSPDIIEGNTGNDVILGDNGELDFAYDGDTDLATLDLVTSQPYAIDGTTVLGGADTISGNAGYDMVIGGTGGDTIYGDNELASAAATDAEDILIGDNADIFLSGDVPGRLFILLSAVNKITTTDDKEASGGNDTITGNAAGDTILGGVGTDTIYGDRAVTTAASIANDGNDVILGDNGLLDFENGDTDPQTLDLISSMPYAIDGTTVLGGADTISGNAGYDMVIGGTGGDTIYGDNATASAAATDNEDILIGDNADITLSGDVPSRLFILLSAVNKITTTDDEEASGGNDTITGNAAGDTILGGVGTDTIYGDRAITTTASIANDGDDVILGDNGLLDFENGDTDPQTLDLISSMPYAIDGTTVLGGADTISGNAGYDMVIGGTGGDTIYGDNATASAAATDAEDILIGDNADITLSGDVPSRLFILLSAVNKITTTDDEEASGGNDTITGNAAADTILGGVGTDTIYGDRAVTTTASIANDGDDVILGDNGLLDFEDGDTDPQSLDFVTSFTDGLGGTDTITGNKGYDTVIGGSGGDTIYGDNATASAGVDDARDVLIGDNADITLSEMTAGWLILGRAIHLIDTTDSTEATGGADTISGNAADDIILGGVGGDTIYGDAAVEGDHDAAPSPKVYDINDIILGDNGELDFNTGDDDYTTIDLIETTDTSLGGIDVISGNDGDDIILGGKDGDTIYGNRDDDIVLGDFGEIILVGGIAREVETIDNIQGGADTIFGNEDEDILIGGAAGDIIDGDEHDDLIFGDNVRLDRWTGLGDFTNPRFRTVGGPMYDLDNSTLVDTQHMEIPALTDTPVWGDWDITLLDHSKTDEAANLNNFGDDYIAGGPHDDTIFAQLGNDTVQGDGSVDSLVDGNSQTQPVDAFRNDAGILILSPSFEAATDGDDYIEGNGGNDVIFGNLGQDDIIGGNSDLFSLDTPEKRPDGTGITDPNPDDRGLRNDIIFGGAATRIDRNELITDGNRDTIILTQRHSRDSDMIIGDNGNIYRLVEATESNATVYREFNYDQNEYEVRGTLRLIPRAAHLLDYSLGGYDLDPALDPHPTDSDIGATDEIHGESGDDFIYGMVDNDILFGDSDDDDLIGGYGHDWISGGTGDDGVLGDDGRIYTSRNTPHNTAYPGEPLYGVASFDNNDLDRSISTPGKIQQATINVRGQLKKTVNLTPFKLGDPEQPQRIFYDPVSADDIIYGGWGNDFLHGGDGDDAISGAEALPDAATLIFEPYTNSDPDRVGEVITISFVNPYNPSNALSFEAYRAEEFALYSEYYPRDKIFLSTGAEFFLNFDHEDTNADLYTPLDPHSEDTGFDPVMTDGDDVIFGDIGNDWLVGGTGKDHLYAGRGDDLMNVDDDHTTNGGLNDTYDTHPSYEDTAYGGAGRDVLIGNTGGDRLIDWCGEFNSYIVPYAPYGAFSVSRSLQPQLREYLYDLSESDGADPTRDIDDKGYDDDYRNGEPFGELGLVMQKDVDWQEQTGAPDDPQAGNIPGGKRDVLRSATFTTGKMGSFAPDSGIWTVSQGVLKVSAESLGGDAVSVFYVDQVLPNYFEILATINAGKPTAGWKSNAYVIFDYQSPTDFKFAGLNASTDKIQMGHRTADGWVIDVQTPCQIKPNRDYNVLVAVHGTTVTLVVDGSEAFSYVFAPRVFHGYAYGLNTGMVGVGSDNSKGTFDNVMVQKLPPEITYENTEDFADGIADLFIAENIGSWQIAGGRYVGLPFADTDRAVSIIDIGLEYGLEAASILELEATLSTETMGGVVFDYYGPSDFKFAAISAESNQLIIGHFTAKHGWSYDAVFDTNIKAGQDYELAVSLKGTTVSVSIKTAGAENWQAMAGHVFNAVVVDGSFGLFSGAAGSSFDTLTVKTDDPTFRVEEDTASLTASVTPQTLADAGNILTYDALAPIVEAAIDRWAELLIIDESMLAIMNEVSFEITDLSGLTLGQTSGTTALIDINAAGYGWFVDTTPYEDSEFNDAASGNMDLLTVVMHELGHILGYDDLVAEESADDLMSVTLDADVRRLDIEASKIIPLLIDDQVALRRLFNDLTKKDKRSA